MAWMKEKAPHPPHIELYLEQLEVLEADSDDEDEEAGGAEAGEAAPAATGGAAPSEVKGLMADADPTQEPAPPLPAGAAPPAEAGGDVVEVSEDDLKNVQQYSGKVYKALEDRVAFLEKRLEVVAEHGYDPKGKWEYKVEEEEEEDGNALVE
jgi:hypothetical protein